MMKVFRVSYEDFEVDDETEETREVVRQKLFLGESIEAVVLHCGVGCMVKVEDLGKVSSRVPAQGAERGEDDG